MIIPSCYLCIPLTHQAQKEFSFIQDDLKKTTSSLQLQNPNTAHITLLYYGDIRQEKIIKIKQKIQNITNNFSPFSLTIKNVGTFGSKKYPRVFWLGVEEEKNNTLTNLKDKIDQQTLIYCQKKPTENDFTAHATIGRVKSPKKFTKELPSLNQKLQNINIKLKVTELQLCGTDPDTLQNQTPLLRFNLK